MQEVKLKSRIRESVGKKRAHKHRARGEVPGILYGHKEDPLPLVVTEHELWQILHNATSEHLILKLDIEGLDVGDIVVLVRDVQHHPVTGDILHVDLQRISMDEKIKVGVHVELEGQAIGVKEFGGVLDHGVREVMIRCKPVEIPDAFHVDVTNMEIGHSIRICDVIAHYPFLEFLDDPNMTLAHVSHPKKMEVLEAEAEEAAAVEEEPEGEAPAEKGPADEGKES